MSREKCCHLFVAIIFTCFFFPSDSNAQVGWKWAIGSCGSLGNFDLISSKVDKDGALILCGQSGGADSFGSFFLTDSGQGQLVIAKVDSTGKFLWVFGSGNSQVFPISSAVDVAGNIYCFGFYDSAICPLGGVSLLNPTKTNMFFLVKISSGGSVLWAQNIMPAPDPYHIYYNSWGACYMGVDGACNVYITETFDVPSCSIGTSLLTNNDPSGNTADIFVAKYDSSGHPIWAKNIGNNKNDHPNAFTVSPAGSLYLCGTSASNSITIATTSVTAPSFDTTVNYFAKFDKNGNLTWAEKLHNEMYVGAIVASSKNIHLCGMIDSTIILGSDTLVNLSRYSAFVAQYDLLGNVNWANCASNGSPRAIDVDFCGNVFISGAMSDSMYFNGYILPLPAPSTEPAFIAEYDKAGKYVMSKSIASGGDDWVNIVCDNKSNFYVGGDYGGWMDVLSTISFDSDTLYNSSVGEALFWAKYKYGYLVCPPPEPEVLSTDLDKTSVEDILLFPNPVFNELNIESITKISGIAIRNLFGQTVYTHEFNTDSVLVDVSALPPGIYIVWINASEVRKFVKQ